MPLITNNLFLIENFEGMNQRQEPDKIPITQSPLLVNISLDRPGLWTKRKGTDLLGTTQAGNGVFGLIEYRKTDSTHVLRAVRSTDLDAYTVGTDSWAAIDAGQFTASTFISSVNYKDRVYHIGPSNFLCWEAGGACTDVGAAADRIKAQQIITAQDTLYVCGVTYGNASAQAWQDRVYFSLFDTTNNVPGDQLWSDGEGSLSASTRFFTLRGPHRASIAYNGVSYHFTETECYEWDQAVLSIKKVFGIGCAGPRALCECNGWIIWMNPEGRIFAWGGAGAPIPLSWIIEDDQNGEAVINSIDPSNIPSVCAGALGNKFWFSIGDVTTNNYTVTNACLRGLITQNLDSVLWSIDSFPVKPAIFANMNLSGKQVLLFGASGVDDVYQMNIGTDDVGATTSAINAIARTAFTDCDSPVTDKMWTWMYVHFKPQPTTATYLKVRLALDVYSQYQTVSDPDGVTPVTKYGVIDMYEITPTNDAHDVRWVTLFPSTGGEHIGLEFSNNQIGENFALKYIAIKIGSRTTINLKPSSI